VRASGPFGPSDAGTLVGLLAEPERLRVFAAVALGASTVEAAASAAGVDPKQAVVALERLAAAGVVVEADGGGLTVATERFKEAARHAAEQRRAADKQHDEEAFADVAADDAAVLRNFVHRGRLTQIPAQRSKKLVVLDWLARRFEPGQIYPEEQVNLMLGMVHADVAALRRYLVDEEFLERRDRFYWRAGGTFDVD
jgi:hypothetical protein